MNEREFWTPSRCNWTHPDLGRFAQADGKVITPMFKGTKDTTVTDKQTGEVRTPRFDPDSSRHAEGGGNVVFGNKFALVSARSDTDRVLLDFEAVPKAGGGGEAGVAMRCFERLVPLLPGAQGVNYDMAMRGKHINKAMWPFPR